MSGRGRYSLLLLACIVMLACGGVPREARAAAGNVLQRLDYAMTADGRTLVRLVFSDEIRQRPRVFAMHHPAAYIVLDFEGASSEVADARREIGRRDLRDLLIVHASGRLRVLIRLARPVPYEVSATGNELLVTLHPS